MFSFGYSRDISFPQAIKVQADGRIVVGGGTNGQFAVTRLTSAGTLDATFAWGGRFVSDVGSSSNDNPQVAALDFQLVNGQQHLILAGAGQACTNGLGSIAVVRLTPGGSVDPSFEPMGNGQVLVRVAEGGSANAVLVDLSNRIVLVGYRASEGAVVRLAPKGVTRHVVRLRWRRTVQRRPSHLCLPAARGPRRCPAHRDGGVLSVSKQH